MSHSIITANRLRDGVAVWRGPDGIWAEHFGRAEIFPASAAEAALAEAKLDVGRQVVVGVYAISVDVRDGMATPGNAREAIRARGPSVRLDLGVQAKAAG